MDYRTLRKRYPEFEYSSFLWSVEKKDLKILYKFKAEEYEFNHLLVFKNIKDAKPELLQAKKKKYIDNLVFNIGMIEMLSYWKAFCSPKIIVKAGFLDEYQTRWWEKLVLNGMGEYFYVNKIDFTKKDFIKIVSTGKAIAIKPAKVKGDKILVPVGGGKDSTVTLELISEHFKNCAGFVINPTKAQMDTTEVANVRNLEVERILDNQIFDLNKKGYLNGHTPFSALLAFTSILASILGDYKYVVFSNEASSDEENIVYCSQKINHQYSKSFEFENDFREYNLKYLSNINYFSFLRPIYDIQIAKLFSKLEKYHKIIRSCNVGQNTDTWCGRCPKCLSTFILLYPFMKESTLKIFGENLLQDKSLKPILASLINESETKPFECVGTRHELQVALGLIRDKKIMQYWGENNLPPVFKLLLFFNLNFKDKKILLLGYGREGKSTEKLLRKFLPNQKIDIADQKINKNYLKNLTKYDIVFKSPGIPNKLPEIKKAKEKGVAFTSQTKIFLHLFKKDVVGITGTKGKSTTASLVHHILKENGVNSELVGNIGKPIFDYLESGGEERVYVAELSSHQLSDVDNSPHVAVFLNIFPEHLDYYESFADYKKAKENIFKFQKKGDVYIDSSKIKDFRLPKTNSNLAGEHNKDNIKAAFLVAREFGLSTEDIAIAIKTFKPLVDRLEVVRTINGTIFINDGLATIPQASLAGVDSYVKNITLILGGFDRGGSYESFGKELAKRKHVKNAILIGQTADRIEKVLKKHTKINTYNLGFSSMEKIVKKAFEVTKSDEIVLLSPAATSFDMFKDYRDRDQQFKIAVNKLT